MKGKIILSLVAASLVSSGSFALEIYKGRIVNHKEWTTGNVKAILKAGDPRKNKMAQLNNRTTQNNSTYASVSSDIDYVEGTANTPLQLSGDHYVFIANDTATAQSYHYYFSICAESSDRTGQCAYFHDEIQLEAGGYFNSSEEPELQLTFEKPGLFKTYTNSSVSNSSDENSAYSLQTSASSASMINIK